MSDNAIVLSEQDIISAATEVASKAGSDPAEIVRALAASGFLATRHERGVVCTHPDCHPADEPLEPCSWVDAGNKLLVMPGDRVFIRFTAPWFEEVDQETFEEIAEDTSEAE